MVDPTQLRAATHEGAGLGDRELELVDPAGDHIPLEQEVGYPEGVDHVRRGFHEADRPALREHQDGRLSGPAGDLYRDRAVLARVEIAELPVPAETDHVDSDVRIGRKLVDLDLVPGRVVEQPRHDDQGHDGVEDLDRQVVPDLPRQLVRPLPEHDDRVEDQTPGEHTHGERRDRGALPQVQDAWSLIRHPVGESEVGNITSGHGHDEQCEAGRQAQAAPPRTGASSGAISTSRAVRASRPGSVGGSRFLDIGGQRPRSAEGSSHQVLPPTNAPIRANQPGRHRALRQAVDAAAGAYPSYPSGITPEPHEVSRPARGRHAGQAPVTANGKPSSPRTARRGTPVTGRIDSSTGRGTASQRDRPVAG